MSNELFELDLSMPQSIAKINDLDTLKSLAEVEQKRLTKLEAAYETIKKLRTRLRTHVGTMSNKIERLEAKSKLMSNVWYAEERWSRRLYPTAASKQRGYLSVEAFTPAGSAKVIAIRDLQIYDNKIVEASVRWETIESDQIDDEFFNNIKILIDTGQNLGPQLDLIKATIKQPANLSVLKKMPYNAKAAVRLTRAGYTFYTT